MHKNSQPGSNLPSINLWRCFSNNPDLLVTIIEWMLFVQNEAIFTISLIICLTNMTRNKLNVCQFHRLTYGRFEIFISCSKLRIILGYLLKYPNYITYMTSVNQKLIVLLKSSRSQVCLSACQTAGHLFEHVADTGRPVSVQFMTHTRKPISLGVFVGVWWYCGYPAL